MIETLAGQIQRVGQVVLNQPVPNNREYEIHISLIPQEKNMIHFIKSKYIVNNYLRSLYGELNMAKNTGKDRRIGAVKDRSQTFNPVTDEWTKRDTETGKFMDGKKDGKPFKGVTKE